MDSWSPGRVGGPPCSSVLMVSGEPDEGDELMVFWPTDGEPDEEKQVGSLDKRRYERPVLFRRVLRLRTMLDVPSSTEGKKEANVFVSRGGKRIPYLRRMNALRTTTNRYSEKRTSLA